MCSFILKKLGLPNAAKNYRQAFQKLVFGSQNRPKEDYILMALLDFVILFFLFYLSLSFDMLAVLEDIGYIMHHACSCDGQSMHHAHGSGRNN